MTYHRAYGFERNSRGHLYSKDFLLQVSMGVIPGFSLLDKFGKVSDAPAGVSNVTVWEGGGTYNHDPIGTAPIVSLISTDAADVGKTVQVQGLDIDGYEVVQDVTCNGDTRVALDTPLWRVYRMQNESDEGNDLAGTVYTYVGTGGVPVLANQRAIIDNGNNQTLMAVYTIPRGKVGFLHKGEVGISAEGGGPIGPEYSNFYYRSRRYGKVFKAKKFVSCMTEGSSNFQDTRSFPDPIPALTDIVICSCERSDTISCWATFDILLVDQSKLPSSFLERIGQPFPEG